jgi:nucleoside-diphosphate-sugar epimerase
MLRGAKVLVTGGTGQVARPIAEHLAPNNEVWCPARYSDPRARDELEARGITTRVWDFTTTDLSDLPSDFTHIVHSAVVMTEDHDDAVRLNVTGTGALMSHCRTARGFLYVSGMVVYRRRDPARPCAESDELGGLAEYRPSYPAGKIATEGAVRALASVLQLPTVLARLNVAYGPYGHGGLPVYYYQRIKAGAPIYVPRGYDNVCAPISTDDIARQAEQLLDKGTVPAIVVNWAGPENITQPTLAAFIGECIGVTPRFEEADITFDSQASDNTRRDALVGGCEVEWRDGVRRLVEALECEEFVPVARPAAKI